MDDNGSERVSEEIIDDLRGLKKEEERCRLVFYCRVGSSYLISFSKDEGKV
jgi:hypothetical protein